MTFLSFQRFWPFLNASWHFHEEFSWGVENVHATVTFSFTLQNRKNNCILYSEIYYVLIFSPIFWDTVFLSFLKRERERERTLNVLWTFSWNGQELWTFRDVGRSETFTKSCSRSRFKNERITVSIFIFPVTYCLYNNFNLLIVQ